MPALHAVILAGGRARRMGGVDKVMLRIDGRALLARAVAAVGEAERVAIVGPHRDLDLPRPVTWVQEEPSFGGPAAALAAGLDALASADDDTVLVLAGDLVRPDLVVRSLVPSSGNLVGVDPDGRRQWACSHVRAGDLARAVAACRTGDAPLRALIEAVNPTEVPLTARAIADLDTPDDAKEYADEY